MKMFTPTPSQPQSTLVTNRSLRADTGRSALVGENDKWASLFLRIGAAGEEAAALRPQVRAVFPELPHRSGLHVADHRLAHAHGEIAVGLHLHGGQGAAQGLSLM